MELIEVEIDLDVVKQEEWTRLTWEETIQGKQYQYCTIVRTDTIDDNAEEIINKVQHDFANYKIEE